MRGSRAPETKIEPCSSCIFTFFSIFDPPKSHTNPRFPLPLQNLVPWHHAQMIERTILCRIALTRALYSVRPNPTLFFFKNAGPILTPHQYRPPTNMNIHPFRKPRPLGPCPNDRAQTTIPSSRTETSVRPNPTLVFSKIRFQI